MYKKIKENPLSRILFQAGTIYAGIALISQMIVVITAVYAPYVIGALLVVIAVLNVKLKDLSD
jgi:hypothetical protein|tara:strand:+ start:536 stop:724 length:189 start_codon:yes stop_codon:yes gene_type:complete